MYLCFKINSFFSPKALLDAMFPVIAMQRFDLRTIYVPVRTVPLLINSVLLWF